MLTIDQARIKESPPAKDQRPNHWVTPQCSCMHNLNLREFLLCSVHVQAYCYTGGQLNITECGTYAYTILRNQSWTWVDFSDIIQPNSIHKIYYVK